MEIWKDVAGYEGIYQVSNLGRVKSLDRVITRCDGVIYLKKGRIIVPSINQDGYYHLKLCKNGSTITKRVHQIVAQAFVEKPKDYNIKKYEVNHIDYNRLNNTPENLEWVTHLDNIKHSSIHNRYKIRDFSGENNPNYGNHILSNYYKNNPEIAKIKLGRPKQQNGRAVKIAMYDKNMNYIDTFDWIGGCAEYLIKKNFTHGKIDTVRSNITQSIKNNRKYLNHYFKKIA